MHRSELTALLLGHLAEITAFSRRLTGNAADADDLVQSVFERAFAALCELRDPAHCRAWLFRIARNAHLDRTRAVTARPELRLVDPDDPAAPEPLVFPETVARIEAHDLERALTKIPTEQAEAVLLSDLWGFEYQEIADITGSRSGPSARASRAGARGSPL